MAFELQLEPLKPKDAIAYFRSKGLQPSFDYRDVWQQQHAQSFTVAKMTSVSLLEDTRAIVDLAISEGWTLDQFKKELAPRLKAAGWWGKQLMGDTETGEVKVVQLGSARRLRTIFEVNMRSAYAAGKWQRIQRTKTALPYLIYDAIDDNRTRAAHRAWDGVCLPVDDPWWDTHYPPCGWRCRCGTISVTRKMAEAHGITKDPPKFPKKRYVNPRTGEFADVEQGIDPGFNFNIGKAPLRPLTARPAPPPLGQRRGPPQDRAAAIDKFVEAAGIGDTSKVMKDRDGYPVVISRDLFVDARGDQSVPRPDRLLDLPLAGKALLKPDSAEWVWSDAPAGLSPELSAAFAQVLADAKEKAFLSRVTPWLARQLTDDLSIEDYANTVSRDAVRHIRKRHGDPATESPRGQIAVTDADLIDIPGIMARPDVVVSGLVDDRKQAVAAFLKRRAGDVLVYIATIGRQRRELAAKTMWKMSVGTDIQRLAENLGLTSDHPDEELILGDGMTRKIRDLRGKINPSTTQLIRRYTRRLDNQVITVDFAAGSWTYDVRDLD